MSRHILSLSDEQLTAFDLDVFIAHAERLNQHNRETGVLEKRGQIMPPPFVDVAGSFLEF